MRVLLPASSTALAAMLALLAPTSPAQPSRIAAAADLTPRVRLAGHTPGWVIPTSDQGLAPADIPIRIHLLLNRPPRLQAAFDRLLVRQQTPGSPSFHRWLTPEQIGEQFGPSPADLEAIAAWLAGQGLSASISPARTVIEAAGPASAVASAFSTSFHRYAIDGGDRIAAASEPAIPAAFASVIAAVHGLADLPLRSFSHVQPAAAREHADAFHPLGNTTTGLHYIFPGDFARIYDIAATTQAGYDGSGVKVAIIGESRVTDTDITQLQTLAGLPSKTPNTILIPGSSDPGLVPGEEDESTVDLTRVLTVAPGVQADLVIASQASGGVLAALQYNVDTLRDPVMNVSYGTCESQASATDVHFYDALFAQAAAEGISTFVASGDSAAAGCSRHSTTPNGTETRVVGNYLCSSSYVTCVGGTEFADAGLSTDFWAVSNNSDYASALGYIPEGAWNEPSTTNGGPLTYQILGSGGGPSVFIPKPAWQTATGVPADRARDTPDLAFTAANHDGFYACLAYLGPAFDCSRGGGAIFSGTSASVPNMAAVAAILNQRLAGPQGNLNPLLYRLAASTPAAFHDATPASSGVSTCTTATASMCNNSTPSASSLTGGLAGYPLTPGFDLVTGLGSLDVTIFLNAAAGLAPTAPSAAATIALTASPTTIPAGQTAVFTAALAASGPSPTGTIQFFSNGIPFGSLIPLSASTAASAPTPFPNAATYTITAIYSGDSTYPAATSAPLTFVVTPVATSPITPPLQPGILLAAAPASLTLAAGAVAGNTSTVTLASTGGFAGPATLTCAITFAAGSSASTTTDAPTCTLAAPSLTLKGDGTATTTLTVLTTLPQAPAPTTQSALKTASRIPGGIFAASLLLLAVPNRRRLRQSITLATALIVFATISGCGITGAYSTPASTTPTTPHAGTTPGLYTVTVTAATATMTRTGTLSLTVQ